MKVDPVNCVLMASCSPRTCLFDCAQNGIFTREITEAPMFFQDISSADPFVDVIRHFYLFAEEYGMGIDDWEVPGPLTGCYLFTSSEIYSVLRAGE
jgi:hypothetical protein